MSYLPIYCELINVDLVLGVGDVKLGHIFDYFPEEVRGKGFVVLIEDILQHDLGLFIEPNLKNDKFLCVEYRNEVVFDDWDKFLDVGQIEALKDNVSAGFGDFGCKEILGIMTKEYFSVDGVRNCSWNHFAHLRRQLEWLRIATLSSLHCIHDNLYLLKSLHTHIRKSIQVQSISNGFHAKTYR